jgi:hypothetical protein
MLGAKALPQKWVVPLNDTLSSSIISTDESLFRVKISDLVKRTTSLVKNQ